MSVMKPSRPRLMPISGTPWRRELPSDAEHGAVASDHQAKVALLADLFYRKRLVAALLDVVGLRLLDEDFAALRF